MCSPGTYGEGLHLLNDLIGGRGHGDDTTAGDGLGAREGRTESLGGGSVRNLRGRGEKGGELQSSAFSLRRKKGFDSVPRVSGDRRGDTHTGAKQATHAPR